MTNGEEQQVVYREGKDLLRSPKWLVQNRGWGSYRATHGRVEGATLYTSLVRMPPAQRSPWHGSGGWPGLGDPFPAIGDGCFFFNIEGEVDFNAGSHVFQMAPLDILLINAVVYSYSNPGLGDSFFWTMHAHGKRELAADTANIWTGDPSAAEMKGSQPYYDAEPDPAHDVLDRISIVHWDEYRRREIQWFGSWGSHWGTYPTLNVGLDGRMLRFPPGQRAQREPLDKETLYLGVQPHPIDVVIDGAIFPVGSKDALIVPAHTRTEYVNTASTDALLFEVVAAEGVVGNIPHG